MIANFLSFLNIPDVYQGEAIRGLFSFAGIFLTGVLGILVWLGKQWLLRRERRRDLLQSLRAEVVAVWKQFASFRDPIPAIDQAIAKSNELQSKGEIFEPVVLHETGVAVFPSLINDLVALEEDEIAVVVSFYRQLKAASKFGEFLQTDVFRDAKFDIKQKLVTDYLQAISQVVKDAETFLVLVDPRLGIPKDRRLAALLARLVSSKNR